MNNDTADEREQAYLKRKDEILRLLERHLQTDKPSSLEATLTWGIAQRMVVQRLLEQLGLPWRP